MISDVLNVKIISAIITLSLWLWLVRKEAVIPSQFKYRTSNQNRLAMLAFGIFLVLEVTISTSPSLTAIYAVSLISTVTYLWFAIYNHQAPEDFWQKRRNRLVGTIFFLALSVVVPHVLASSIILPILYSLMVAHTCFSTQNRIFTETAQDMLAIQSKLRLMEAQDRNREIFGDLESPKQASQTVDEVG